MKADNNDNKLSDYLFHQGLDKLWAAVPREQYVNYFNNYQCQGVIRSRELSTVIALVIKVDADSEYLAKIQQ